MGGACIYGNKNVNNKDVNLDEKNINNEDNNSKTQKNRNRQINSEENDLKNTNQKSKMSQIIEYFNEEELSIREEYIKQKEKTKIMGKKNNNGKYELMLKRLLEQQNIKKIGPKRRPTIRTDGDKIKNIVKELLQENKDNVLKGTRIIENGTLIIKHAPQKQGKFSMTIDKNPLLINTKKVGNNFFKKRNSLNEMINKDTNIFDFQKHKSKYSMAE